MVRGLDERQKQAREKSKLKIFEYISKREPCTQASIVKESGVNDPKIVRKTLLELKEKDKKISSKKFQYMVEKQKGREFYFVFPISEKVWRKLGREEAFRIMGDGYYFGVKNEIPLEIQYMHKLIFLKDEFLDLCKKFSKQNENYDIIIRKTGFEKRVVSILNFYAFIIDSYYKIIDSYGNDPFYFTYFDSVFRLMIEEMDRWHSNFKELRTNQKVGGPLKAMIANMMIDQSKSGVMKKIGMSPKSGRKYEKELFNKDGTPKAETINQLNLNSIGKKEFGDIVPSGENLMKKWKKLQNETSDNRYSRTKRITEK